MAYQRINDELYKKVVATTLTKYDAIDGFITGDNMWLIIRDLLEELEDKDKKIKELQYKELNDFNPEIEIPEIHDKQGTL